MKNNNVLKTSTDKIIRNKFGIIKKNRLARLFMLSYAYLIILAVLIGIFWPLIDGETSLGLDMWTILFIIPFLFTALYIILQKKQWIILPAKIIFWILLVLGILLLVDIWSMIIAEPILAVLFLLMIWPLLDLYKNDLRQWIISLKNRPFANFKKKSEISIKEISLITLTLVILNFSFAYDAELIVILRYSALAEGLLIIAYLLLKGSPLKSIIKLIIFIGCTFLLSVVLVSIINNGLTRYMFFENINNIFIREFLRYTSVLAPSLYGLGIIFLNKNKTAKDGN